MGTAYPSMYIETEGTIKERFAETAFKAELPNGKITVAFVEKKNEHLKDVICPGDKVKLTISPADFDRARIDAILDKEDEEKGN